MTIRFSLEYKTVWGEQLVFRAGKRSFSMQYSGDGMWEISLSGREILGASRGMCFFFNQGIAVFIADRVHALE